MGNGPSTSLKSGEAEEALTPRKKARMEEEEQRSRRKSTGRNERRSIAIDPTKQASIDVEIDESQPNQKQLAELFRVAFQHASAHEDEHHPLPDRLDKAKTQDHTKRVCEEFVARLEADKTFEEACVVPKLKPNPKNAEMEKNLKLYQGTLARLRDEEARWQALLNTYTTLSERSKEILSKSGLEYLSSEQKGVLQAALTAEEEAQLRDFTRGGVDAVSLQVDKLEEFAEYVSRVEVLAKGFVMERTREVAESAFKDYADIDDPQKIIRNLIKNPSTSS